MEAGVHAKEAWAEAALKTTPGGPANNYGRVSDGNNPFRENSRVHASDGLQYDMWKSGRKGGDCQPGSSSHLNSHGTPLTPSPVQLLDSLQGALELESHRKSGHVFAPDLNGSTSFSVATLEKRLSLQWGEDNVRRRGSRMWETVVKTTVCGCANLSTARGRRNNALLILTIAIIPVFALIVQNAISVHSNSASLQQSTSVKQDVLFSTESGNVVHYMQIERGTSALYLSSKGLSSLGALNEKRADTDRALRSLTQWVGTAKDGDTFVSEEAFYRSLVAFRQLVTDLNATVPQNLEFYSKDIAVMIGWLADSIQMSRSGSLWPTLVSYHMLIISKEQAGQERALGSTFFAQGGYSSAQMTSYLEKKLLGESYLQRFQQYAQEATIVETQYAGTPLQKTIESMRATIVANVRTAPDVQMGQWWFDNMTQYINILKLTQDKIAEEIVLGLELEIQDQNDSLVVSIIIMTGAVVLLVVVVISVNRLTKRLQSFAVTLQEKTVALNIERKRSENLLNELLPQSVARKLMANEPVEPESFSHVTIFFSDIVGFTTISAQSSPLQVIDMLNILYKTFDEILDMYSVYKVETIGDAYMIASGLPVRNEEGHAVEMAECALELRDTICHMAVPHLPGHLILIRIGLNSGSVVSGIVGHKMPRYCLFGDTVNVASRMESNGLPKIQIALSTYRELHKRGGFRMEKRGEIEIKGKGLMTTYFLEEQTSFVVRRRPTVSHLHPLPSVS